MKHFLNKTKRQEMSDFKQQYNMTLNMKSMSRQINKNQKNCKQKQLRSRNIKSLRGLQQNSQSKLELLIEDYKHKITLIHLKSYQIKYQIQKRIRSCMKI